MRRAGVMMPASQERNMKHLRGDVNCPREQRGPRLRQVAVRSINGTLGWGWGRLASYSAMSIVCLWATCSTPLYPPFSSLSCLFSFPSLLTKDWPGSVRVCVYTPVAWVPTEPLGYCHNTKATAQNFRLTTLHFDQGWAFAKTCPVF